ncbi:hypothetical protein [Haliangium sp.]
MRFFLGLLVGTALGAAGAYAWLERPWLSEPGPALADAGAQADQPARKQRKRRGRRGRGNRGGEAGETGGDPVPVLSEADRRLVWKGDQVALPPRQVDFGAGTDGRPLSGDEINRVLRAQSGAIQGCIAEARGDAELEARIVLEMLVDGTGAVGARRIQAPAYLFAHGLYPCARQAAGRLRFPATGAPTVVTAPYNLH